MVGSLKSRAIEGVVMVGVGRVMAQIVQTGGNIFLARLLLPDLFGRYAMMASVVALVGLVTNISFGQAVIASKTAPTDEELKSMHWLLVGLGIVGCLLVGIMTFGVNWFYGENFGVSLAILAISLMLVNLRVVPSFLLERELVYTKIVAIEFVEIVITQVVTLTLAYRGFRDMSFVWGNLVGKLASWRLAVGLTKWQAGNIRININGLIRYLPYALDVQLTSVIAYFSSALVPIYIGKTLGQTQVGLLAWAAGMGLALRAVSDTVARVVFPVMAKVQNDAARTSKAIHWSLISGVGLSWVLIAGFGVGAKWIVPVLFTPEWTAGLPLVYVYLGYTAVAVVEQLLIRIQLGMGRSGLVRNINIVSVVLVWGLAIVFVGKWGVIGVPVALIVATVISVVMLASWLLDKR